MAKLTYAAIASLGGYVEERRFRSCVVHLHNRLSV
jgi:hypothetical protein